MFEQSERFPGLGNVKKVKQAFFALELLQFIAAQYCEWQLIFVCSAIAEIFPPQLKPDGAAGGGVTKNAYGKPQMTHLGNPLIYASTFRIAL